MLTVKPSLNAKVLVFCLMIRLLSFLYNALIALYKKSFFLYISARFVLENLKNKFVPIIKFILKQKLTERVLTSGICNLMEINKRGLTRIVLL